MIPLRCRPATSGRMLIREADDDDFRLANDDADGESCPVLQIAVLRSNLSRPSAAVSPGSDPLL